MSIYSEEVMKRFANPKNAKEMKNPNAVGIAGNLRCGDQMKVFLKIENNKIIDASFLTFGCAAAIASSDALCDLAKGKTIDKAMKITKEDIVNILGKLPPIKLHCSVLGIETLHNAIKDYKEKH